jgi:tetratricopeptide (TPR) repeat protein
LPLFFQELRMYASSTIRLINGIAYFLRFQKQYKAATRIFSALLRFQPERAFHRFGQGLVCAEEGKYVEAQSLFRQVLIHEPEHSYALACLGLAMRYTNHPNWRQPLEQAREGNDGLGGKEMAEELLNSMDLVTKKAQKVQLCKPSLVRLQKLRMRLGEL